MAALKAHHKAGRVVMIGHSGGAANAGVLLGSRPDIVDAVILISCPCDVPTWRDRRGRKPLNNPQSPHDYLDKVKPSAKIYTVTGTRDTNTAPYLAKAYVAAAQARGLAAVYLEVEGAGHGFFKWPQG